jgi:glycosyltransferase involved in cell wall biosynthesis
MIEADKMKLLFVTSTLTSGGAERVISILANEFSRRGHDVEMIALTSISPDFYKLDEQVRFIHADKACGGGLLKELWWFRKHVKREKPDVVIAFMEAVYEFVLMALLGTGIPVISSERIDPATLGSFRKLMRWFLLPTATAHVVQTQNVKAYYKKHIQKKTHVIYNPVNERVYEFLDEQNINKENRIISVGRLYPQKNQTMMIEAFSKIANDFPDWNLFIYGEGFLRADLEKQIKEIGLVDRVLLPGRTENVIEEVANSKVFCLSSNYEGMSNAMIEAMCVGTPIITTNVSGTDELLHDGEDAIIVKIGDVDGMANAFRTLLSDADLRKRMAERCKEKISLFSLDSVVSKWENLIVSVTNK